MPLPQWLQDAIKIGRNPSATSFATSRLVRGFLFILIALIIFLLDFEGLTPYIRDLPKKQSVTGQSLRKIEEGKRTLKEPDINTHVPAANYALTLRSAEYQNAPALLDDIVARYASGLGLCGSEPIMFDDQEAED